MARKDAVMSLRSTRRPCARIAPVLLIWIVSTQPFRAQRITGDIIETITDTSGSAIPKAKVILSSLDTGRLLETSATEAGDYSFVELKPGRYGVLAENPGFERK